MTTNQTTAIATIATTNGHSANGAGGLSIMNRIAEFQQVAKLFADSGMFSDTKGAAQCFVKIMAGAELGIPPFTSMNAFHVIQGKVTMAANTIAARIKSSGKYNYRIVEKSAERCVVDFYEAGDKTHTEMWDAKRARTAGTKNMDKYPEAMLFARAISAGGRAAAPDVVGQYYAPEELGADVDADGNVFGHTDSGVPTGASHSNGNGKPSASEQAPYVVASIDDKAKVVQYADEVNTLASELAKSGNGKAMTDEQRKAFSNQLESLMSDVDVQLEARGHAGMGDFQKTTDKWKALNAAIQTLVNHDAKAEAVPA